MKNRYLLFSLLQGKRTRLFVRFESVQKRFLRLFIFIALLQSSAIIQAQTDAAHETENRLKKAASKYFDEGDFADAYPLYSQLVSLYARDPNYNYRFGACMLFTTGDKSKALDYLEYSMKQGEVEDLAYYYLGRALHLNYRFDEAVNSYQKFKEFSSSSELKKYPVEQFIEMCNNGRQLVANMRELEVLRKKNIDITYYFEAYDMHSNGGIVISEPDEFKSKIDKEENATNLMYLTKDKSRAFFSSYGSNAANGKDIYLVKRTSTGTWGTPESLGDVINTNYDEDYPVYDAHNNTLYFCSKGHNSMGGYDIFKSVYSDSSHAWAEPVNLNFPINSPDDDILFVPDSSGKTAFFASARTSKTGMIDVYKVALYFHAPELIVVEGTIRNVDGKIDESSKIIVRDSKTDSIIDVFKTSPENGKYSFSLTVGGRYSFSVEDSTHKSNSQALSLPASAGMNAVRQDIQFTSSGNLVVNTHPEKISKDSVVLLANNSIREQAQMNVNVDTTSVQKLLAQNVSINTTNNSGKLAMNDTGTGNTELSPPKLEQEEGQLNDKAAKTIDYASSKMEESQELYEQAKNILHRPGTNATQRNTDSVAYAKSLLNQSAVDEEKGIEAYQYGAEYKNEAAIKQIQIDNAANSNSSSQNQTNTQSHENGSSDISTERVSPGDLVRRQAAQVIEDSLDLVNSNDELTGEKNELQQKSHEFLVQAGQTTDSSQKVALLQQSDDLLKSKQEKEQEINENNRELQQMHEEHVWLLGKVNKADSGFTASANTINHKTSTINSISEVELQKEVDEYAIANNITDSTGKVDNYNLPSWLTNNNSNDSITSEASGKKIANQQRKQITLGKSQTGKIASNTPATIGKGESNGISQKANNNSAASVSNNNSTSSAKVDTIPSGKNSPTADNIQNSPISNLNNPSGSPDISKDRNSDNSVSQITSNSNSTLQQNGGNNSATRNSQTTNVNDSTGDTQVASGNGNNSKPQQNRDNNSATRNSHNTNATDSDSNTQVAINKGNNITPQQNGGNNSAIRNSHIYNATDSSANNSQIAINNGNNTSSNLNKNANPVTGISQTPAGTDSSLPAQIVNNDNISGRNNSNSNANSQTNYITDSTRNSLVSINNTASKGNNKKINSQSLNVKDTTSNTPVAFNNNPTSPGKGNNNAETGNSNTVAAIENNHSSPITSNNTVSNETGNNIAPNDNSQTPDVKKGNHRSQVTNNNNISSKQNRNNDSAIDDFSTPTSTDSSHNLQMASNNNTSIVKESNVSVPGNTQLNINIDKSSNKQTTKSDSGTLAVENNSPSSNISTASIENNVSKGNSSAQNSNSGKSNINTSSNQLVSSTANNATASHNNNVDSENNLHNASDTKDNNLNNNSPANPPSSAAVNSVPVSFGYHNAVTPHDAMLDSLAGNVPPKYATNISHPDELVTSVQYTDTVAVSLKQKSQNYFDAAAILKDNAKSTRTKALAEKNKNKVTALNTKADSLDRLVQQLNLKGNENLAEADYRQYHANVKQIKNIDIQEDISETSKITAAKTQMKDADVSYKKSLTERDEANNTKALTAKHTYIKSARLDLATAILKQQKAEYLYFQADSLHQAKTTIVSNAGKTTSPSYPDYLKSKGIEIAGVPTNNASKGIASTNVSIPETNSTQNINNIQTDNLNKTSEISNPAVVTESSHNNINNKNDKRVDNSSAETKSFAASADKNITNNFISKSPAESVTLSDTIDVVNVFHEVKGSPYSASNPIPVNPPLPKKLFFKVQVGAFRNPIPQDMFKGIEPIIGLIAPGGFIRYSTGIFISFDSAKTALGKIRNRGYSDAFIIAFYDGKRISIQEAMAKLGITPRPVFTSGTSQPKNVKNLGTNTGVTGNATSSPDSNKNLISENTIVPSNVALIDSGQQAMQAIKDTVPPEAQSFKEVKGLVFTVQVGSFTKHKGYVRLRKIKHLYSWEDADGTVKYNSGTYKSIADAKVAKDIIVANTTVRDAFISAYFNGRRISIADANELLKNGTEPVTPPAIEGATKNVVKNNVASTIPVVEESKNAVDTFSMREMDTTFVIPGKTGVVYTIKIATYTGQIPVGAANKLLKYTSEGIEPREDKQGSTTYYAGKFTDYNSAELLQQKLNSDGFLKAMVIAFFRGRKISLDVARSISNK